MKYSENAMETKIRHLMNCAEALDSDTHAKKLLKSYYVNTCNRLASGQITLPKNIFGVKHMCSYCSLMWQKDEMKSGIKARCLVRTSKINRLINKLDVSKKDGDHRNELTKKQRKRAKWLKKRVTPSMQITCSFCHHKTLVPAEKSKVIKTKMKPTCPVAHEEIVEVKRKKKKKKKDPTAGLKIVSLPKKVKREPSLETALKISNTKAGLAKVSVRPLKVKINKDPSSSRSKKSDNRIAPQTKNTNTQQKNKGKIQQKAQSKTQKQNTILKLASMLKNQTAKGSASSQQGIYTLLK